MPHHDVQHDALTQSLIQNFRILADEVQLLNDRKTILEHKLRYAHEQYQQLADKHASGDPDVSSILAKLQLPPELQVSLPDRAGFVPLPDRRQAHTQLQTAVAIRDGRQAAEKLVTLQARSSGSTASGKSVSGTSSNMRVSARRTSLSTVLEQDFTIPGKRSSLLCPFTDPKMTSNQSPSLSRSDQPLTPADMRDPTPHKSADPICAALYAETMSSPPASVTGSAAKCPIRYLDQHSPEEVARYFETHKHEIPRSHEICVKRYQRNEEDIRKLDAKYGNLVSMIQGLGQKHQPMLPAAAEEDEEEQQEEHEDDLEHSSNERVENWAKDVSVEAVHDEDEDPQTTHEDYPTDREPRFDRLLKEIRVGESPSRPWGISVPILDPPHEERPISPPPAPVSAEHIPKAAAPAAPAAGRCPFGHGQQARASDIEAASSIPVEVETPAKKCPMGQGRMREVQEETPKPRAQAFPDPYTPPQPQQRPPPQAPIPPQPAFINPPDGSKLASGPGPGYPPQMIFTGPVFIGYPMEQALAFMQQYNRGTQ